MADDKGEKNGEKSDENNSDSATDTKHTATDTGGNSSDEHAKNNDQSIREMVRAEIKEALKGLKPEEGTGTPRRNDIEAEAERMVREASERLEAKKQHEQDHEKIRSGNQPPKDEGKPEPESAPKKVRKLTKILWGDAD